MRIIGISTCQICSKRRISAVLLVPGISFDTRHGTGVSRVRHV